ncbi:uncharacterized protein LOC110692089 [Chenopodium quinoa]|uniref:uncharacterized protein LOC110692089 n=1 Tax=Chenopodium quinoa TaxID=63459 RepID=UPI000B798B91|nr:uncharacterized protein LOC110692089 [Chenopodium quinoa]
MRVYNILDWWESCFLELSENEVAEVITLCWAIWGARNSLVVEGELKEPGAVVRYVRKIGEETLEAKASGLWVGVMKVNVDASFIGELGCGLRAVVRDAGGDLIAVGVSQNKEKWDVKVAEVRDVLGLCVWLRRRGVRSIGVEGDCLQVVQALKQKDHGFSEFHLMLEDIFHLCRDFDCVSWSFVKRRE